MNYLEVSAKTGKGVNDAFSQMGLKVYDIMKNKGAPLTREKGASMMIKPKAKEDKKIEKETVLSYVISGKM